MSQSNDNKAISGNGCLILIIIIILIGVCSRLDILEEKNDPNITIEIPK